MTATGTRALELARGAGIEHGRASGLVIGGTMRP